MYISLFFNDIPCTSVTFRPSSTAFSHPSLYRTWLGFLARGLHCDNQAPLRLRNQNPVLRISLILRHWCLAHEPEAPLSLATYFSILQELVGWHQERGVPYSSTSCTLLTPRCLAQVARSLFPKETLKRSPLSRKWQLLRLQEEEPVHNFRQSTRLVNQYLRPSFSDYPYSRQKSSVPSALHLCSFIFIPI